MFSGGNESFHDGAAHVAGPSCNCDYDHGAGRMKGEAEELRRKRAERLWVRDDVDYSSICWA